MGKPSKGPDTVSKADKKFEKKLQFYAKVRDTVASLSVQKEIEKKKKRRGRQNKLKAYDLSALSEFLPEFNASRESAAPTVYAKLNCKNRQKLILEEGKNLSNVLNHPAFQADPFGSIHQHLQSTQPAVEEQPKKKTNRNGSKKKNRRKGKASSQPQSMDM
ncbi:PREDICTED: putative ribosome biogenesis protein slx9-like [Tarenaya hassleriana]|uniref:putative ribosome biogenesis protein slx9-like n=1 Tax=Tarenaya hassleriana TaxID=28532 RepID=UPI00053C1583|nr:PREDICTED: putative ribosome biogenesis protein slx9-like [Tarenaya hassleriana]XP_010553747.1 PREDICTED: putative ribosome biogenesis protein slx9-like [Tarenaya hassleriana]XP_010553754.1 PREDICTED: putative ribosome biogenesis protein slx9-like [Tarenaya hassleriana]XP_010553761.1 PREDICTED: putative ribosome biogenesis protein slx9-like [Tarenaya hassleriana]